MKQEYKAPQIVEEKITLEDVVATSSFGGDWPGDTSAPFDWAPFNN